MNVIEETIEATLDSNGELRPTHRPSSPAGTAQVTIRVAAAGRPQRGLADVIQETANGQRYRGFPGRSAAERCAEDGGRRAEDVERDRELDAASIQTPPVLQVRWATPANGVSKDKDRTE